MPIIDDNEDYSPSTSLIKQTLDAPPAPAVDQFKTSYPQYENTFVDSRNIDFKYLSTYVNGSPWPVEYFSRVITRDSELGGQQLSVGASLESYNRIMAFELRVTNSLQTQQDPATKAMQVQGTSNVFGVLIPNEGDMFIASIGEGRLAVFQVKSSSKKSIFANSIYEIEYFLVSDTPQRIQDLRTKAVLTKYFHKHFLAFGDNPLIVEEDHHVLVKLGQIYERLIASYFQTFFSKEYQTLIVPGQAMVTYDPYLTRFMLEMFSPQDAYERRFVRNLNTSLDWLSNAPTLWQAVAQRDPHVMNRVIDKAALVSVGNYFNDPSLASVRYTGVARVVYPKINKNVAHLQGSLVLLPDAEFQASPQDALFSQDTARYTDAGVSANPIVTGSIYAVTCDDSYVFSEHFYSKDQNQSVLEGLVWDYLEGKKINLQTLEALANGATQWGVLEQFYYIPLILAFLVQETRA